MRCVEIMNVLEILRLTEHGLTQREIAGGAHCGKSTVNDVQRRSREAGLTYAKASAMKNAEIRALLYPTATKPEQDEEQPDWAGVYTWLKGGRRRNLRYSWEEYKQGNPRGLGYSQYCKRYKQWCEATGKTVKLVLNHEPGKELFVDWIGDTLGCVVDAETGEVQEAHFFVATLGCSDYPYAEAFPDEKIDSWLTANVHALEYICGVPQMIVPDNCKTAVKKPNYYDPTLNKAYLDFSEYYNVAIIPARVKKPKDKALVEGCVGWLETWLLEWLSGQRFFTFAELNREIVKRIKALSSIPFQARPGSRVSNFIELDKPALRPLPLTRFEWPYYAIRRVPEIYHVEYDGYHYSVPYTLYKADVTIRATDAMIEIINEDREVVAVHQRRKSGSRYVTDKAHMPPKHLIQLENNGRVSRDYLEWAATIGNSTYQVIDKILRAQQIELTAYRSCMGILQCAKKYSPQRLEAVCAQALAMGCVSYTNVINLLKTPPVKSKTQPLPVHENLRDPAEFQ